MRRTTCFALAALQPDRPARRRRRPARWCWATRPAQHLRAHAGRATDPGKRIGIGSVCREQSGRERPSGERLRFPRARSTTSSSIPISTSSSSASLLRASPPPWPGCSRAAFRCRRFRALSEYLIASGTVRAGAGAARISIADSISTRGISTPIPARRRSRRAWGSSASPASTIWSGRGFASKQNPSARPRRRARAWTPA